MMLSEMVRRIYREENLSPERLAEFENIMEMLYRRNGYDADKRKENVL